MNTAVAYRKHTEVKILEVRSMTEADLELLQTRTPPFNELKSLRDRHHRMAWMIALGKSNLEVAAECRCSPQRVATLKQSPAFADLITKYRAEIEAARIEALRTLGAIAAENMIDAEEILQGELKAVRAGSAQTPGLLVLNRIATDRMDRFGYGKHSTSESRNVNINFAAKLEAAIARSRVLE